MILLTICHICYNEIMSRLTCRLSNLQIGDYAEIAESAMQVDAQETLRVSEKTPDASDLTMRTENSRQVSKILDRKLQENLGLCHVMY